MNPKPRKTATTQGQQPRAAAAPGRVEWLTHLAFVLALAIVVARLTFVDGSRWSDDSGAGIAMDAPRSAGPATALGLDLLACVPAILVLARRAADRQYVLRWSWSLAPLLGLALWGALSVLWSADKFTALLAASRWVGASALLFAASQLVRSWRRLRLVAGMCVGLLLALFAHALIHRTMDVPDTRGFWTSYTCRHHPQIRSDQPGVCPKDNSPLVQNRALFFEKKGWHEDDFAARQFERKIFAGEAQGFFASPNTLAATTVLLLLVGIGVAASRLWDGGRADTGAVALLVGLPLLAYWVIYQARSTTAMATPILGAAVLAVAWRSREMLAARSRRIFCWGLGAVVIGAMAIVAHGLFHKTLFHTSLTFRWHYWTGGMKTFFAHPLLGVGLDNFGLYYLADRLPNAPEEVKDPHNLLVKFLVELGIVGALLALAWLGRLAWEITRPVLPPGSASQGPSSGPTGAKIGDAAPPQHKAILTIAAIGGLGMLLNVIASIDFASFSNADRAWYDIMELLRRVNLLGMLLIGMTLGCVRSLKGQTVDEHPAPLLLYAMIVAIAMFLLHNMIDFSLFEPGPMMLFAVVAGSVLGVRQPSVAGKRKNTVAAAVALGVAVVAWLVAGMFVYVPALLAEDAAYNGAVSARDKTLGQAVSFYMRAREQMPLEAEYPYRAAQALIQYAKYYDPQVANLLGMAIRTNPMAPEYYLMRARYLLRGPEKDQRKEQILADYRKAVELNPSGIDTRLEYGDALASYGTAEDKGEARKQYQQALRLNDLLAPDEPRRRTGKALAEINERIEKVP